ncbi:uncharacterized protein LOC110035889 [Phalaenopsis equestris]|uniref:uncharacterized protein LOC110035889 n=1 Tax=Phalaenopsis equestris TaxID=78828 RepID=UPI0009E398ED|nr:uncharacterized protein LOC110035889 [Phalaenopsis equestris]
MVANGLIERAAELLATCQRHLSSATRRVRSAAVGRKLDSRFSSGRYVIPFVSNGIRRLTTGCTLRKGFSRHSMRTMEEENEEQEEEEMWKKTILMGEKCQPLEFSGAIYYDSKGSKLAMPLRSPIRTPLLTTYNDEKERN